MGTDVNKSQQHQYVVTFSTCLVLMVTSYHLQVILQSTYFKKQHDVLRQWPIIKRRRLLKLKINKRNGKVKVKWQIKHIEPLRTWLR